MLIDALISFLASTLGSLISLFVWFHLDLEGFMEEKRHKRIMRIGSKRP
jgi:hypothetical protein